MTKLELAWITGFYEGEGTCNCPKRPHHTKYKNSVYVNYYWNLQVSIVQKSRSPLLFIRNILGYGTLHRYYRKQRDEYYWYWLTGSKNAREFLHTIRPYMKSSYKIKQVDRALKIDEKHVNPERNLPK